MTIRISLRALLFILYTVAVLAGAFGISYTVFEWRDDDAAFDTSAIERKIDELEEQAGAGPTQAELDAEKCKAALQAAGNATLVGALLDAREAIDRYCE